MLKCVFILVLLSLCVSAQSDTNLNREIIDRLQILKELYNNDQASLPLNYAVNVPVKRTYIKNLPNCVHDIKTILMSLLRNLKMRTQDKHYVEELMENLKHLKNPGKGSCKMTCRRGSKRPFNEYIDFFQKLNTIG